MPNSRARSLRQARPPALRPPSQPQNILDGVIGQAATAVTVIVGGVYACGASVFFVRLWLLGLPATAVLGQLPHDLLLTTGLAEVLLPCVVFGILLGFAIVPAKSLAKDGPLLWSSLRVIVAAGVVTASAYGAYRWDHDRRFLPGVLRRTGHTFASLTFVATLVCLFVAFHVCRTLSSSMRQRRSWAAALFAIALIPGVVAIMAALPLPSVFVCRNKGLDPPTLVGNLIGTGGGKHYIAQYETETVGKTVIAKQRHIVVVPDAQVRFITLAMGPGQKIRCAP